MGRVAHQSDRWLQQNSLAWWSIHLFVAVDLVARRFRGWKTPNPLSIGSSSFDLDGPWVSP